MIIHYSVGLYPPTCWVILSDRRTGGIIIDEKYDTSTPTGRLQKVLAELLAASVTLGNSRVLESAFTALDTVSSWELEECIDIDDLIRELEIEAEYYLDKAATRRAEEALEMIQRQLE